jgi:lysophospholipase L1-like esterase
MRTVVRMFIVALALTLLPAPAHARVAVICAIGDSLVAGGPILNGNPGWPSLLQTARVGRLSAVINTGVGGYTVAQAQALFEAEYEGRGCTHAVILVGTNDLANGDSAATVLTALEALISRVRNDTSGSPEGITIAICTIPPRGGSASWDATKEARRLSLRTSVLGLDGVTAVDLESMAGTGTPVEMDAAYRYSDLLHFNGTPVTGGTVKVASLVDAVVPW